MTTDFMATAKKQSLKPAQRSIEATAPVASSPETEPEPEQPIIEAAPVKADPPVASIYNQRDALQIEIGELQRQQAELQRQQALLERKLNQANYQIAELDPPQDTMDAIRQYINAQNHSRRARIDRVHELIELGAEPQELQSVRSPLDQALKRKARKS